MVCSCVNDVVWAAVGGASVATGSFVLAFMIIGAMKKRRGKPKVVSTGIYRSRR